MDALGCIAGRRILLRYNGARNHFDPVSFVMAGGRSRDLFGPYNGYAPLSEQGALVCSEEWEGAAPLVNQPVGRYWQENRDGFGAH